MAAGFGGERLVSATGHSGRSLQDWRRVAILAAALVGMPHGAGAAGGSCCADLEERIAELEETTARKRDRKVSLTISGQVNLLILGYHDGRQGNAAIADNINTSTRTRFLGQAKIDANWSAGYKIEIEYGTADSNLVSQLNNSASRADQINIRNSTWFLRHKTLGAISVGRESPATDDIILRGITIDNAFPGTISDTPLIGGGIILRNRDTGALLTGPLVNHNALFGSPLDTSRRDIIRYETPAIMGARIIATYGQDFWDAGIWWIGKLGTDFEAEAAAGYFRAGLSGLNFRGQEFSEFKGSATILHAPTGLFFTGAWLARELDSGNAPLSGRPLPDQQFYYLRPGIKRKVNTLGFTTLYGEYSNTSDGVAGFAAAGFGEVVSSEAQSWGIGIQQKIDAAAAELYLGYRNYQTDIRGFTAAAPTIRSVPTEDVNLVWSGMRISF